MGSIIKENWKSLAGGFGIILFTAGANWGIINAQLSRKVDREQVGVIVQTKLTEYIMPLIETNEDDIIRIEKQNNKIISLAKEMKINMKRLMQAQGLRYIEDTNKDLGTR